MVKIVAVVSGTTSNMEKFSTSLEKLDIPHIYCTDHVLHLTAKNNYLVSWYNREVAGVLNYAEDINLDEIVELSTTAKAPSLVDYFLRSNQAMADLKQKKTRMQYYMGNKEVGLVVEVVTCWWSTLSMYERLAYIKQALQAM